MGVDWQKILLGAGGAAAVGALLYYLLKEESDTKSGSEDAKSGALSAKERPNVDKITKEQVSQILQEIIKSQEQMRGYMKELTAKLVKQELDFQATYEYVKRVQPEDPLEKHGLSMCDFDELIDKHQSDQQVREAIGKIMGAPSPNSQMSDKVQTITVEKIIEVHQFMLKELEEVVEKFSAQPDPKSFDMKTVTIAAQAVVGAKVEKKFGYSSEDIEGAVLKHHASLATNQEFARVNMAMQKTMSHLMGSFQG